MALRRRRKLAPSKISAIGSLAIFICMALTPNGFGGESRIIPDFTLSQTYNDNLTFKAHNPIDDYIVMARPRLTWEHKTEKTLTVSFAEFTCRNHAAENELDRTDHRYRLSHQWSITEKSGAAIMGLLQEDNTIEQEFEEPDFIFYTSDRDLYQITPSFYWNLTERTRAELAWNYIERNYGTTAYSDYTNKNGGLTISHLLADRDTVLMFESNYAHQHYPSYATTIDQYRFHLGLTYPLSERLHLTAWSGARYTETDYKQFIREFLGYGFHMGVLQPVFQEWHESKTEKNWGYIGLLKLTRSYEKGDISLEIQRDIDTSTALGQTLQKDTIACHSDYKIFRKLKARLHAEITTKETEAETDNIKQTIYKIMPSVHWQLNEELRLVLLYHYTKIKQSSQLADFNHTTERNRVILSITFNTETLF
ncbi:MAG: hypothetical protein SWH68_01325 [Thermodesulfobacteriota bacterium]|nr:hypothetical protein [Thermodesulfobacteriota bacterium]